MTPATVFINNRTQAVRLPAALRLPEGTRNVFVRAVGRERIIVSKDAAWDSFFLNGPMPSSDFLEERASQLQSEREAF